MLSATGRGNLSAGQYRAIFLDAAKTRLLRDSVPVGKLQKRKCDRPSIQSTRPYSNCHRHRARIRHDSANRQTQRAIARVAARRSS